MLRLNQVKLSADIPENKIKVKLKNEIVSLLRIKPEELLSFSIIRRSLDARKKPDLFYSYCVDFTLNNEKKAYDRLTKVKSLANNLSLVKNEEFVFPVVKENTKSKKVIIVGSGPAGLFCAYFLAQNGMKPIVLERGMDVDARTKVVENFWKNGTLLPGCNVQFGEGGAGTFSDGKLNTLVKDPRGLNRIVLETFVRYGAQEKILYDGKPHIGTDVLKDVVKNIRNEIISLGGTFRFNTTVKELILVNGFNPYNGAEGFELKNLSNICKGVVTTEGEMINGDAVVLAIGHSARDTFYNLYEQGLFMEQKPFAVGLRVQHKQKMINFSQYGRENSGDLGAAAYKLTAQTAEDRAVFSFCMCPGGYVVNASSEEEHLAVNGMSYSDRAGENANSAIIVSVKTSDFSSEHPLAGIELQRELESKAYNLANGAIPVQRYGEFKEKVISDFVLSEADKEIIFDSELKPEMCGEYSWTDVSMIMPCSFNRAFVEGMDKFDRNIKGFASPDVILAGIESRTSSPVRITRDENFKANFENVFPCGEGAGYAGGITSAAMDGIKTAEKIVLNLNEWD